MTRLTIALSCITMAAVAAVAQQNPPTLPGTVQAPPQPYVLGEKGTGVISGVVTDGVTGEPIEGAFVALGSGGRGGAVPPARQITDALGRFMFTDLPAFTEYTLTTTRLGYFAGAYRRIEQSPIAARLVLRDGEWHDGVNIRMWQPAAISGFVRDESGDPVVGVPVRVLQRVTVGGGQWWASGAAGTTDDRGWYRIPGLTSGMYVVHVPSIQITLANGAAAPVTLAPRAPEASIAPAGSEGRRVIVGHYAVTANRATAYPMAFHPAARTLDAAATVTVVYGRDLTNVDVALAPVPTARVTGRVNGPPNLVSRMPVRLLPLGSEQLGPGAEAAITSADADGRFVFEQVPTGDYTLAAGRTQSEYSVQMFGARAGMFPASQMAAMRNITGSQVVTSGNLYFSSTTAEGLNASGRAAVSVGATPVPDVNVPLQMGVTVSGRYVFDGEDAPPPNSPPPTGVVLEPADGDLTLGVHRTGAPQNPPSTTFTIPYVLPGNYIVAGSGLGSPWHMISAEWRNRNLLGSPMTVESEDVTDVVIHLSRKRTWIEGSVTDGAGPATGGGIITFSVTPSMWTNYGQSAPLIRTSTVVNDGTYRVQQIPPGEYYMIAVSDIDRYRWQEPGFLRAASALATRVKVTLGTTTQVQLRLMQVPR